MERVWKLTSDPSFMKRFTSDQNFLNAVYPERLDVARNIKILSGEDKADSGAVVPLPFGFNAQTHVEVERLPFWTEQFANLKILHFTEKKGWQCPEQYERPSKAPKAHCNKKEEQCFCQEGYRWWRALRQAKSMVAANPTATVSLADNKEQGGSSTQCVNSDFRAVHKVSVWTMLTDNPEYIKSALKLGRGIKQHTTTPLDMIVMELKTKPLPGEVWKRLSAVGFTKCTVEPIHPTELAKTRRDLREKFAVLRIWDMPIYDTLLFLDADTLVRGSLDELLSMNLRGKPVGVSQLALKPLCLIIMSTRCDQRYPRRKVGRFV